MKPFGLMSRKKVAAIATACMITAGSLTAAGSDLDLSALLNIVLQTGSFLELDMEKSPVTMTIIDSDRIRLSGSRNLNELLEVYVPGFQYMTNKWNGTIWGMRGVAGDRNDKIIVLINGKKQNLQNFHGFATETTLGLLGDIERVEVLRGPAGLVYGSGAIAGVVNIVTLDAQTTQSYASGRVEMNGKNGLYGHTVQGAVNHIFDDGASLSVYVGSHKSEGHGYRTSRVFGIEEKSPTEAFNTGPKGVRAANESPWATGGNYLASADFRVQDLSVYARMSRQITPVGVFFPEEAGEWASPRGNARENIMLAAEYGWDIDVDRLSIEASATGVTNQVVARGRQGEAENILATTGERRYEGTLKYLFRRVDNLQLAAGLQYGYYDIGNDLRGRNAGWIDYDVDYENIAFFTEGFYTINDIFSVGAGIRYDNHTKTDGVASPKAAIIVTPNPDHVFKFIVQSSSNNADALTYEGARGSQPGRWSYELGAEYAEYGSDAAIFIDKDDADNYTSDINQAARDEETGEVLHRLGNLQAPTQSIDPETSRSFELATTHRLNDRISLASSFSYNQMRDLHMWNGALSQTQNVGEYDILSVELEANYTGNRVDAGVNVALVKPVDIDIKPEVFSRTKYEPVFDENRNVWTPGEVEGDITSSSYLLRDQVSYDGEYFNSIHTATMKMFADWRITDYLTFHNNARVFFGLWGREELVSDWYGSNSANLDRTTFDSRKSEFFGITESGRKPMVKWNSSLHFELPHDLSLGIFAYDILGKDDNIHAVRSHQMSAIVQNALYTVDQRTFALSLTKRF